MSKWRRVQQPVDFKNSNICESHHCIDCGVDTAPGCLNREQAEKEVNRQIQAGKKKWALPVKVDSRSEQYFVHAHVWQAAGMTSGGWDGCLRVGFLEARIGRRLNPSDFSDHIFNIHFPGTQRLLERQGRVKVEDISYDCLPEDMGPKKPRKILVEIPEHSPLDKALDLISLPSRRELVA